MELKPYGLVVALSAAAAFALTEVKGRSRLRSGTVSFYALLSVIFGFALARLGPALVSQGGYLFKEDFLFNFSRGGYMYYGVVLGCVLSAWITGKVRHENLLDILDAGAAPAMLMTACCRMAEGLVGCGFGRNITEWFDPWMEESMIPWEDPSFLYRFPFGVQDYYGEWNWSVFVFEAIVALVAFVLLLTRKKQEQPGGSFWLMLLLYAGMQITLESMRQDAIPRWGFVKVNQLLSAVTVLLVLAVSCHKAEKKIRPGRKILAWVGAVLCCGIAMMMEFALEQKIDFLLWMRMDLCYIVMLLSSIAIILIVDPVRKKAFAIE